MLVCLCAPACLVLPHRHGAQAYYAWFALEGALFGSTEFNSCNGYDAVWTVLGSLLFAVVVMALFLALSVATMRLHDATTDPDRRIMYEIVADSFVVGIGWTVFNMSEVVFKCELTLMYETVWGEVVRACFTAALGFLVYRGWSHKFENQEPYAQIQSPRGFRTAWDSPVSPLQPRSFCNMLARECITLLNCGRPGRLGRAVLRWESRLRHFGDQIVQLVVALTIMYVYFAPIARNYSGYVLTAWMLAAGCIELAVASVYGFMVGFPEPMDDSSLDAALRSYVVGILGWLTGMTFWYGFNNALSDWFSSYYGDASYLTRTGIAVVAFLVVGSVLAAVATCIMHVVYGLGGGADDHPHVSYDADANPVRAMRIVPSLRDVEAHVHNVASGEAEETTSTPATAPATGKEATEGADVDEHTHLVSNSRSSSATSPGSHAT